MNKIIGIDIDGCLSEYPKHYLNWVNLNYGTNYKSIKQMKSSIGRSRYDNYKNLYRKSGYKRTLPLIDKSAETIAHFNHIGYQTWIITTRPKIDPVEPDTLFWLQKKGIIYQNIVFIKSKLSYYTNEKNGKFTAIIDDDHTLIKNLSSIDIDTTLINFKINSKRSNFRNKYYIANSWDNVSSIIHNKLI